MGSLDATLEAWAPRVLSVLRIVAALLFLQSGLVKLFNFPVAPSFEMTPLYYAAGTIELIGSPLLLVGLFTRPVAFLLSGEMAFAYFKDHAPYSFYPFVNDGSLAILFCFVFFHLVFAGGGPWSIDRLWRKMD
ncbi:MAG: DoxX family protein [Hyphomicrobiales bacterium]